MFIIAMAELRIPRLNFNWKARLMQIFILSVINVALFKPYEVQINLFSLDKFVDF